MNKTRILSREVEYSDGSWLAEGYLAYQADLESTVPCVLIAHDWSGLNEHTRATADKIAELGYIAFAVDVYGKGIRGDTVGDNSHLMQPLIEDRSALRDRLLAAVEAAKALEFTDPERLGAIGYCFGGLCALDLARNSPKGLRCALSFHGLLTTPDYDIPGQIAPRLLLLHGWEDPMAPPTEVVAELRAFTEAGATWEMHAYGHAMHAFTFTGANYPERGIAHHPLADQRSWKAAVDFIEECMR